MVTTFEESQLTLIVVNFFIPNLSFEQTKIKLLQYYTMYQILQ